MSRGNFMKTRTMGATGPSVSMVGLGCMGMSDAYGPSDVTESVSTIHAALDAGITLFNTGDFYGMGHNEMLLAEALGSHRGDVVISVKFGAQRTPSGQFVGFDCRPSAVKTALAYSLKRLKTDYIDVYEPARVDPSVPIEETVGAIAEMVAAGYVRHVGLSEASEATVRKASAVHPIAALETEYGVLTRDIEAETLPGVRALNVGVVAYGVLSRGLIGGASAGHFNAPGDFRGSFSPRFQGENLPRNLALVERFAEVARDQGDHPGAARLRLGPVAGRGHHPPDRRPAAGPPRRGPQSDGGRAFRRGPRPDRRDPPRRRGLGDAVS